MGSCGDVDSQLLEQMPSVIVALDAHLDSAFQRCGNGFVKPLSFLHYFSHVFSCTENNLIIGCHVASILSNKRQLHTSEVPISSRSCGYDDCSQF